MSARTHKLACLLGFILLLTQSCTRQPITVACNAADLIKAIQTANKDTTPDTLELAADCVYTLTSVNMIVTSDNQGTTFVYGDVGLPAISTPITINGHNATITRAANAPHFRIFHILDSGNLTLNDLTITNGYASSNNGNVAAESGAAIYNNKALLTINRATFKSNTADYNGGAIYTVGSATTNINDSTISDNSAPHGGGILIGNTGILIINGSNITSNTGSVEGGGINIEDAKLTINSSNITSNHSSRRGGGIVISGASEYATATISETTLQGNTSDWCGGGISATRTRLMISGSRFLQNQAGEYGGGLCYESTGTETINIRDSSFDGNTAVMDGGGIHFNGALLNILYGTFTGNNAQNGGAIHNGQASLQTYITRPNTSVILSHTVFLNNSANQDGGCISNSGALAADVCTFSNNTSTSSGGGIQNLGAAIINDGFFLSNHSGSTGGGVYNQKTVKVTGSTFAYNFASSGGGLATDKGGTILINDTFSNNIAKEFGGGIFSNVQSDTSITMAVNFVTVAYNSASNGGGIASRSGLIQIKNSIIADNTSGADCFAAGGSLEGVANNLNTDGSCPGFTLKADPLLEPLANNGGATNTHALGTGSPAIDAAQTCTKLDGATVSVDQRGNSRPQGYACDLGAYESESTAQLIATVIPGVETNTAVNCREGTSQNFAVTTYIPQSMKLSVVGINPSGTWYLVQPPDQNGTCWIWGQAVTPQGDLGTVKVVPDPLIPTPLEPSGSTSQNGCWVYAVTGAKTCTVPCPKDANPGGACQP
jgi:predicted outer membrane repeat protein